MEKSKTILALTIDLLANGAFNHLQDDDITAMHHLLLRLNEPLTTVQQNLLLTFWNHAAITNIPFPLLYRCNTILQQLGRSPLEEHADNLEYF